MLGGGTWVTQNKILPGAYINFVNASKATATLGERGIVAIALPLGKTPGKVIEITASEFVKDSEDLLGKAYTDASLVALREIFCHARKCLIFDLGTETASSSDEEETPSTSSAGYTVSDVIEALEPLDFNTLAIYTNVSADVAQYVAAIKTWRDDIGKKVIGVGYNLSNPNHEGIINVVSTVSNEGAAAFALVAWVTGAEAGCEVNKSVTNMIYDGEYTVVCNHRQTALEQCITNGQFVFHLVYGDVRVLEDINSLTQTTEEKGEDFKSNQTMRVCDQIANDIAKLFNQKYLGQIPNNESGRISFWGDIVSHHRQLEQIEAIQDFDSSLVTVEEGLRKSSVVVNDVINPVNCMTRLYMTVVVS